MVLKRRWPWVVAICALLAAGAAAAVLFLQGPKLAAGGLLHPFRHTLPAGTGTPVGCEETWFAGRSVRLQGWRCTAEAPRKGTVIYLHGVADNRGSGRRVIARMRAAGFDVIAYDSRAHGGSDGAACTYGFYEKDDLRSVIDGVSGPLILIGTSMGAAVALQAAANDPRVSGIVAAEVFSDLETVARERAPRVLSGAAVAAAFRLAEMEASFRVADVSPVRAAASIHAPVLLIHGALDTETRPEHSRRVLEALAGPKRLILVREAGHNQSLRGEAIWDEIVAFTERTALLSR